MNYSKFVAFLATLLLLVYPGLGQIPPSPNASSQIKFASQPVNLYAGVPSIQAPLMTLPGRHLSVPIGLSYHAGGFKVQEIAGPVGLGWALNAGGLITRVVQGIPDDEPYGYSHPQGDGNDIEPLNISGGEITNYSTNFFNGVAGGDVITYDAEPDIFYFNVLGRTGRFVLDGDGNAVLLPHQDVEIKVIEKDSQGRFLSWQIRTEDGMLYKLGISASARETTEAQTLIQGTTTETQPARTFVSSWYLNEISSPQSSEKVTFTYASAANVTYEYHNYAEYGSYNCGDNKDTQVRIITQVTLQPPRRLALIESDLGTVSFDYTYQRADLPGQQALSSMVMRDLGGNLKQRIDLTYSMFNSCEKSYGISGADDPDCKRLRLDNIEDLTDGSLPLYAFLYQDDETYYLPHRFSQHYDHWGYANRGTRSYSFDSPYDRYLPAVTIDGVIYDGTAGTRDGSRQADAVASQAYLLTKMINVMGGYTKYAYEGHYKGSNVNDKVGGVRIRSIETFDGQSNSPAQKIDYNYHSSGQAPSTPTYGYKIDYANTDCFLVVRYAHSLVNLFDLNGAVIGYSKVSQEFQDGSQTASHFTNFDDYPDSQTRVYRWYNSNNSLNARVVQVNACGGRNAGPNCQVDVPPFPLTTSYSWRRGLLTRQEQFNSNGQMMHSSTYGYNVQQAVTPRRTLYGLRVEAFDEAWPIPITLYEQFLNRLFGTRPSYDNFDYRVGVNAYISEPVYLKYQIDSLFDQDRAERALVTRVDYDIDETYLTVKSQSTVNSEGQQVLTQYLRANNLKESNPHGSSLLTQAHMNGQVLEQSTSVDGQVVQKTSSSYTKEGDLIVPTQVTIYPDGTGAGITVDRKYDTHGNIIQTQRQNDLFTAYLWGYNHSLKVAEVIGQTYQQATSGINLSVVQGDQADAIRSELDQLRQPNRLVTTYTYDPLVGIISETGPAGITTYYDYDDRNRLQYVRDHRQQYVTRYQYHYLGQAHP